MNKSDILELKKRMKKDKCTFNRITGCCVGVEKEILTTFNSPFLVMEEGDQHKFLEIASKALSGKLGNNLLELNFPNAAEDEGGSQHTLMKLKKEKLKHEEDLTKYYEHIIDTYEHTGSYAILLFHDSYDVPDRGTDRRSLDESTEVYEYIICAICPINLSKPGLSYFADDGRISERIRDWVLGAPEVGFTFPAFTERSSDIHTVMYYAKTPKESHTEIVDEILRCSMIQTSDEKKDLFSRAMVEVFEGEENPGRLIYDINESLRSMIEADEDVGNLETGEPSGVKVKIDDVVVSDSVLREALLENNVPEDKIRELQKSYKKNITGETSVDQILDRKLIDSQKHIRREEELLIEIAHLKEENANLRKELKK